MSGDAAAQLWSQTIPANYRFVSVLGGAAFSDRETDLIWTREAGAASCLWAEAHYYCDNLTVGNRQGWRVPSLQELMSLRDPQQNNPQLPAGYPFAHVHSDTYWTSTLLLDSHDIGTAWIVTFATSPTPASIAFISTLNRVWCVRGGAGSSGVLIQGLSIF
jgi:hypothetical protein